MAGSGGTEGPGGPPGRPGGGREEFDELIESRAVRPYTVTGGRTRSSGTPFPIEALVRVLVRQGVALSPEKVRILDLASTQYVSIAEISAHLKLPVGVVRVLVGDLVDEGLVSVAGSATDTDSQSYSPATSLRILESVLDGISAL